MAHIGYYASDEQYKPSELLLHNVNQEQFIEAFGEKVLPSLV